MIYEEAMIREQPPVVDEMGNLHQTPIDHPFIGQNRPTVIEKDTILQKPIEHQPQQIVKEKKIEAVVVQNPVFAATNCCQVALMLVMIMLVSSIWLLFAGIGFLFQDAYMVDVSDSDTDSDDEEWNGALRGLSDSLYTHAIGGALGVAIVGCLAKMSLKRAFSPMIPVFLAFTTLVSMIILLAGDNLPVWGIFTFTASVGLGGLLTTALYHLSNLITVHEISLTMVGAAGALALGYAFANAFGSIILHAAMRSEFTTNYEWDYLDSVSSLLLGPAFLLLVVSIMSSWLFRKYYDRFIYTVPSVYKEYGDKKLTGKGMFWLVYASYLCFLWSFSWMLPIWSSNLFGFTQMEAFEGEAAILFFSPAAIALYAFAAVGCLVLGLVAIKANAFIALGISILWSFIFQMLLPVAENFYLPGARSINFLHAFFCFAPLGLFWGLLYEQNALYRHNFAGATAIILLGFFLMQFLVMIIQVESDVIPRSLTYINANDDYNAVFFVAPLGYLLSLAILTVVFIKGIPSVRHQKIQTVRN